MELKRVVVTGLGALTPLGNTVPEYWNALLAGTSGANLITRFDASKFKTKFACELKGFNVEDHIERKEARKMDPYTHYAMVVVKEAIIDSGMDLEKINRDRVGVIWGSGIGGLYTFQEECFNYAKGDGTPRFNPFFIPKMIADIASGYISIQYGFRGPNYTTVSACASSNNAIIDACNYIRLGKADVFVTGGSEAAITEAGVGGFNALKALSENNDNFATASRPFDQTRDGFVLGGKFASTVELMKRTLVIQVNGRFNAPSVTAQGKSQPRGSVEVSLDKTIKEGKWGFNLRVTDIFNTQGFNFEIDQPVNYQRVTFKWETRRLIASVRYKFGKTELTQDKKGGESQGGGGFDF